MMIGLRSAEVEDARGIASVYLASRKRFLPFAPLVHSDDDVRGWIAGSLIPSRNITVAEDKTKIVGMMATFTNYGVSWIDHLYISPEFVGRGIGTRMLKTEIERLATPIRLYCFQQNINARRFYEQHGFRPVCWTDGADNEERCPDVLYELSNKQEVLNPSTQGGEG